MNSAYNTTSLYNLAVVKETKRWFRHGLISQEQFERISDTYKSDFYHPNFLIRVLLFVATVLALAGATGLLMVMDILDDAVWIGCVVYGLASLAALERIFIRDNKHYKTGVNEALIYHSCVYIIIGISGQFDFNSGIIFMLCLLVLSFAAFRYVDLLSTCGAFISLCLLILYILTVRDGFFMSIIPFVFMIAFTFIYFTAKKYQERQSFLVWKDNLIIVEALSLVVVYAAGNYFVVREMSVEMLDLYIPEGEDLPFAIVFYALTVIIPAAYLYFGIKRKDVVMLRVSLFALAFSVFTFKYYFSLGHPEITLTIAGAVLTTITLIVMNYLKVMRNGFTRENLLEEKWGNANIQAIVVAQTMGGNVAAKDDSFHGGGGGFGGGGASGDY